MTTNKELGGKIDKILGESKHFDDLKPAILELFKEEEETWGRVFNKYSTEINRKTLENAEISRENTKLKEQIKEKDEKLRGEAKMAMGINQKLIDYSQEIKKKDEEIREADRRAGESERKQVSLKENIQARENWLRRAKKEAGYDDSVSFDIVWKDTLKLAREGRES